MGAFGLQLLMWPFLLKSSCLCLTFYRMPVSRLGAATRAFVAVLLLLARRYELLLEVRVRSQCSQEALFESAPRQGRQKARRVLTHSLPLLMLPFRNRTPTLGKEPEDTTQKPHSGVTKVSSKPTSAQNLPLLLFRFLAF